MILKPVHLSAAQIFRFKLFLKKAVKKSDKTRRFSWLLAFPHLPLTKKPNGIRMGKGKGKLECWFTNVSGGSVLIEFKNLRKTQFIASHLRTFKYQCFKEIYNQDSQLDCFKDKNGEYLKAAPDVAIMFPVMEIAGFERVKYIDKILHL